MITSNEQMQVDLAKRRIAHCYHIAASTNHLGKKWLCPTCDALKAGVFGMPRNDRALNIQVGRILNHAKTPEEAVKLLKEWNPSSIDTTSVYERNRNYRRGQENYRRVTHIYPYKAVRVEVTRKGEGWQFTTWRIIRNQTEENTEEPTQDFLDEATGQYVESALKRGYPITTPEIEELVSA